MAIHGGPTIELKAPDSHPLAEASLWKWMATYLELDLILGSDGFSIGFPIFPLKPQLLSIHFISLGCAAKLSFSPFWDLQ